MPLPTDVSEEAARRGASRIPQLCPECVRVFVMKTTQGEFAGALGAPSDGLAHLERHGYVGA
jgi:hypothetical protein